jgi:hypothetical protein
MGDSGIRNIRNGLLARRAPVQRTPEQQRAAELAGDAQARALAEGVVYTEFGPGLIDFFITDLKASLPGGAWVAYHLGVASRDVLTVLADADADAEVPWAAFAVHPPFPLPPSLPPLFPTTAWEPAASWA